MYRKSHPLFMLCNTPTHVGSGSELGIVDLPIQRERHTSFPKFEGSSLKGALREAVERNVKASNFKNWNDDDVKVQRIFGYDEGSIKNKDALQDQFTIKREKKKDKKINEFAGCVGFSDARILLFPVKSMRGVFAWITCPQVLSQYEEDMKISEVSTFPKFTEKELTIKKGTGLVAENAPLLLKNAHQPDTYSVVLEEYAYQANNNKIVNELGAWMVTHVFGEADHYWKTKIKNSIVILPDDDFRDFVNLSTDVITRTKINNITGTVESGALFTEEYLPPESILYSLLLVTKEFLDAEKDDQRSGMDEGEVLDFINKNLPSIIQIGGNSTLGKGIIKTQILKEEHNGE